MLFAILKRENRLSLLVLPDISSAATAKNVAPYRMVLGVRDSLENAP